jgi:hypothetical protein
MYRQDAQASHEVRRYAGRILAALCLVFSLSASAGAASPPSFDLVVRALTDFFKSQPDFQRHDLLNQQLVADALAAVAKVGWDVPDAKQITELALPVNSFLVGELATPDGKRFMRKISTSPGTYSRLDRLSRLSQGQQVVSQLVGDVGGDVFITYLATTNSGHNLGQMMAGTPNGSDLNLPTGRIYTADDLLAALKKAYAKEFGSP